MGFIWNYKCNTNWSKKLRGYSTWVIHGNPVIVPLQHKQCQYGTFHKGGSFHKNLPPGFL